MRYDIRSLLGTNERYANSGNSHRRALRRLSDGERREEARAFLNTYCKESGATQQFQQRRWAEIRRELAAAKFYRHTPEELAFGARVAWRNHGRCIGRLFWESLEVFDCREITDPAAMAARITDHMTAALSDGRVRSMISIFAPVENERIPARIESGQITQFAGYLREDGQVLGDRQNVEATRIAMAMGWKPPTDPSRFDLLPYFIRSPEDVRSMHALPLSAYRLVPINHPTISAISDMGLAWYAVPCVSNMILSIGGIDYPCAPFNGFYMGTEIASRNFADTYRYDLLPEVAQALDLDMRRDPLWKDVCLTELNRAVLHSFKESRVTIVDHHAASKQFMDFYNIENAKGRHVSGDWRWLVPPQASGSSDLFHLRVRNKHDVPNFYASRATDGKFLMPFYGCCQSNCNSSPIDAMHPKSMDR
ncbi:nitric oxide synthase oxygenase [Sphingobium algorifonticola]|uniref:Nitric oxide synthase oxygenase n=1 Tax=Sphingobium algorifonticola TaxID=2008318 RepID=A0A437JDE4_9SPHN|nr:nitric oxide synthase oxygenase [Sphingobium algorifonticola]RVT43949.1 nitric oxide synthase oxygenase [Sphingobium algorifonticola]